MMYQRTCSCNTGRKQAQREKMGNFTLLLLLTINTSNNSFEMHSEHCMAKFQIDLSCQSFIFIVECLLTGIINTVTRFFICFI